MFFYCRQLLIWVLSSFRIQFSSLSFEFRSLRIKVLSNVRQTIFLYVCTFIVMLMKHNTASRKCLLTQSATAFPQDTHYNTSLTMTFHLLPPHGCQQPWSTNSVVAQSYFTWMTGSPRTHVSSWMILPFINMPKTAAVRTKFPQGLLISNVLYQITSRCNLMSFSLPWIIQLEGSVWFGGGEGCILDTADHITTEWNVCLSRHAYYRCMWYPDRLT